MAKYEKVVEYCQKLFSKNQFIYQKVWHFCDRHYRNVRNTELYVDGFQDSLYKYIKY